MSSFGEMLRQERESRNAAVEEIASSTQIDPSYLEALERNEFDALPGGAFGKMYIRAYAEVLGFDPGPLLAAYDRERTGRTPDPAEPTDRPARDRSTRARRERLTRLVDSDAATRPREEGAVAVGTPAEPLDPEIRRSLRAAREQLRRIRWTPPSPEAVEAPAGAPDGATGEAAAPVVPAKNTADEDAGAAPPGPAHEVAPAVEPVRIVTPAAPVRAGRTGAPSRLRLAVRPSRGALALLVSGVLLVAGWIYLALLVGVQQTGEPVVATTPAASEPARPGAASAAADPTPEPPVEPVEPMPSAEEEPIATAPAKSSAAPPIATSSLTIREFGVGRGVVNRRLVGETDRFVTGDVAWFFTRVLGGRSGQRIRHVWLHEGRPMQSIVLDLGGGHWRTQSRKTLGQAGSWTVEARDEQDRVLARASFTCAAPEAN